MKNLLLLCQSQSDVTSLPAAAQAIKSQSFDGVWFLFSPAVLVDTETAGAEHDRNIADLDAAVSRCAASRDFEGAKNYQAQLDAARLDRAGKVKDAWKTLTDSQRDEATRRVFGQFFDAKPAPNVRHQILPDHYEPAQFIAALNSIKGAWFAPFVPGTFTMDWVSSLGNASDTAIPAQTPKETVAAPTPSNPVAKKSGNAMFTDPRYRELTRMHINQLGPIMLGYGLNLSGSAGKIAAGIWKHEKTLKAA